MADLPPSSRKTRLRVAAPFSMIRFPTAVDPVNEIRSTLGDSVSSSPTRWSDDVTTWSTPAGKSVCSATRRPSRVAFHGVSGAGLRMTVLPVARACPNLLSVTSSGKFHGTMAPTTPTGSFQIWRMLRVPRRSSASGCEVTPLKLVDQLDGVAQRALEGDVELVGVGGHARASHLEDELLSQLLAFGLERVLQLGEAARTELAVGRPARLVESPARGVDGPAHLGARSVGDLAQDLLGRRVDVVERPARIGADELAVDQHPGLVLGCCGHCALPPRVSRLPETALSKSAISIIEGPPPAPAPFVPAGCAVPPCHPRLRGVFCACMSSTPVCPLRLYIFYACICSLRLLGVFTEGYRDILR